MREDSSHWQPIAPLPNWAPQPTDGLTLGISAHAMRSFPQLCFNRCVRLKLLSARKHCPDWTKAFTSDRLWLNRRRPVRFEPRLHDDS